MSTKCTRHPFLFSSLPLVLLSKRLKFSLLLQKIHPQNFGDIYICRNMRLRGIIKSLPIFKTLAVASVEAIGHFESLQKKLRRISTIYLITVKILLNIKEKRRAGLSIVKMRAILVVVVIVGFLSLHLFVLSRCWNKNKMKNFLYFFFSFRRIKNKRNSFLTGTTGY